MLKTDDAPIWLQSMRAATGLKEDTDPGESNPQIVAMATYVGQKFSEQADYAALYTTDDTAWCGVAVAYCMATADISGPFGKTDTDRWMWALSWADSPDYVPLDEPRLGCVCVFERSGGGHVSLFEYEEGPNLYVRGGNQSNAVTLAPYSRSSCVGFFWPKAAGDELPRRVLEEGDVGSDVSEVQRILGFPPAYTDGDFGPTTEGGVKGFQRAWGLSADGVVGQNTWAKLDELDAKMKAGSNGLDSDEIKDIVALAKASQLQSYNWPQRGRMPAGYTPGMCLCYALALKWLDASFPVALTMSQADTGNPNKDALSWYSTEFAKMEMDNSRSGRDTMRHLIALQLALGPRESSGNHFEGRDMSASNVSADTCEAGLFQQSWDSKSAAPNDFNSLFNDYWEDPQGFLDQFNEGATPSASRLDNYGSGQGTQFQWLAKFSPAFSVMCCAVCLRVLRQHFGPINRKELDMHGVELADDLLRQVEIVMEGTGPTPPEPPPEDAPTVNITTTGDVNIVVNGQLIGA